MIDKETQRDTSFVILLLKNAVGDILIQQQRYFMRSWDVSAIDEVIGGEKPMDAVLRSADEQLGISAKRLVYSLRAERPMRLNDHQTCQIFVGTFTGDISELAISEDIKEIKWVRELEFEKLLFSDEFVEYPVEVKKAIFSASYLV